MHGVLLRQEARKKGGHGLSKTFQSSDSVAAAIARSSAISSRSRPLVIAPVDPWAALRAPIQAALDASLDPDLVMALQLGLDEQTFRQLRAIERRDIRPEDYDLLGQLHSSIKPATLTRKHLKLFPTETYRSAARIKEDPNSDAYLGVDFWRLPVPLLEDTTDGSPTIEVSLEDSMPAEVCSICLVDFEDGDELRKLTPCGHRFHRECIDRWLLEASTTCPVDNVDLRHD